MDPNHLVLQARALVEQDQPNHKAAYALLSRAAELDVPEAIYALATWYLHGGFLEQDGIKATRLLKKAAKRNWPDALYDLAISYEGGLYVKKNKKKAFELYLKAAIRGSPEAVWEVSRCYYFGIGIQKSNKLAEIWGDRAEELGSIRKD